MEDDSLKPMKKIAVLDNEEQAQALDSVLTEMGIAHFMKSYHDSALDGIFQISLGWGHIEAYAESEAEILEIIASMEQTRPVQEDETST